MEGPQGPRLQVGEWRIEPAKSSMSRGEETVRLEARTLRLLLHLVARQGEVVSLDELLDTVWPDVTVGQDSVYQAITSLRRVLGDDPKEPKYVATVPRQGYRLVAAVTEFELPKLTTAHPARVPRFTLQLGGAVAATFVIALLAVASVRFLPSPHPPSPGVTRNSIAVLPFLDLTNEAMSNEYVADGVTEEVIDRLSQIPGVRVPSPAASFYFKGRHVTVGQVANALHVPLILDGSLRKSGDTLRVAVRLIEGNTGNVLWSQSYDRPSGNILKLEDEIASNVVKALGHCLERHARARPA